MFFDPKNVDGIVTINTPETTALTDWKHEAYAYIEQVPIDLSCVTKQGITGDKLRWKMELDLRNIIETYPLGSVRSLNRETPRNLNMGTWKLHTVRYSLDYKRAVDDYTSDCTLSYGSAWVYDGDRVANGDEGTWAETEDGATGTFDVTTNPGMLSLIVTVSAGNEDYHVTNGTNLALSSTLFTKIRYRYKTSSASIKAKIIIEFSDASTQEIQADASSTTWEVASATITTGKTIDHIRLHADHATGTVYYDWIMIYTDDFVIPNVTNLMFNPTSRNVNLGIPSGIGLGLQNLGADPAQIDFECDLDMETSTTAGADGCWQLASGDDNDEVFLNVMHNQDDYPWQWFVWGNKAARVSIDSVDTDGNRGTCRVMMHEYVDVNAGDSTYTERWNL